MTAIAPGKVVASIDRALWGEVSSKLRSVQFKSDKDRIRLRFFFAGPPDDADKDFVGSIGAEVAADFPGYSVTEEIIPTEPDSAVSYQEGWQPAFARREPALAR